MICSSRRLGEGVSAHLAELATQLDNKDYDGDETTFMLMMDHYVEDMFSNFEPHHNLLQLDQVLELSKNASMTDGIVASASEWLTQSRRIASKNQTL